MLSFSYYENIDNAELIEFVDGTNILIGTNGSGKSNFLEIINQLMNNGIIYSTNFTYSSIRAHEIKGTPPDFTSTIRLERRNFVVPRNNDAPSTIQRVKVVIGLTQDDINNLIFLIDHRDEINQLLQKYSTGIRLSTADRPSLISMNSVTLFCEDRGVQRLDDLNVNYTENEKFAVEYIHNYNVFQNLLEVANEKENKNWKKFSNPFAMMTSIRNYNQLDNTLQIQVSEKEEINSAKTSLKDEKFLHSESKEPSIFNYIRKRFGYAFHRQLVTQGLQPGIDPIEQFNVSLFSEINDMLTKFLKLKLHISRPDPNSLSLLFTFINSETNKRVEITQLSSGQRGIIHFILNVLGSEVENGIMIIDEPEIHLHPQMQELCLNVLSHISKKLKIQFLIATHSPIFVNENTVDGLSRFSNESGFTKIIKPNSIPLNIKNKIRLLTYTNSAIVFFSERVIFVESYVDEIFFQTFLNNYKKRKQIQNTDLEFLNITSSSEFESWKKFLNEFKIPYSYIGDCDNLKLQSVTQNHNTWMTFFPGKMLYPEIVNLQHSNVAEHTKLLTEINQLQSNKIFLLKSGSMENYFLLINGKNPSSEPKPDPEDIVNFCLSSLDNWITSNVTNSIVQEIDGIFDKII